MSSCVTRGLSSVRTPVRGGMIFVRTTVSRRIMTAPVLYPKPDETGCWPAPQPGQTHTKKWNTDDADHADERGYEWATSNTILLIAGLYAMPNDAGVPILAAK